MVNKCVFIGNLAADPEIKTAGQDTVANFRIGCSENWTDKAGQRQTTTEWVSCVAWRKLAEIIEKYAKKGQQVYVEGKMKTRTWEKDGVKHYATEILVETFKMLGGKREDAPASAPTTAPAQTSRVAPDGQSYDNNGDDSPF